MSLSPAACRISYAESELIPNKTLREYCEENGITPYDIARALGYNPARWGSTRIARALGMRPCTNSSGKKYLQTKITYGVAVRYARSVDIDPIDVDL